MCDFGVLFEFKLSFVQHIDLIISKAYSMFGFIMRICFEFFEPLVLRSLFLAHVRSHLEYASVVWFPNHQTHIERLESVHKIFFSHVF